MIRRFSLRKMLVLAWALGFVALGRAAANDRVDFNRDIRPILSEACFQCHGPDATARQADLRLDRRESVIAGRSGEQVVTPILA
jgi:mono/diheme cytochrome c family protein